ncbi:MAG TPA: glycosyltransferase family protein [Phnomibacter sp.]|nr:glycosyltransferase family protein [Phnomibacter sp.]
MSLKIFYAVQATGNGHISRAIQLMPYLQKLGEVDVFLSGANASLDAPLPIRFRSNGLSLFYSTCGGLDYKQMWKHNSLVRALREAQQLPVEKYDIVINDFDFITSRACRMKGKASVQFGHQASFMSIHTPRPEKKSFFGEMILKRYAPASRYIGLHFQPYDTFIFPPVIKDVFLNSTPTDKGHITVYLSAYERQCLEHHFKALPHVHFHWFLKGIRQVTREGNLTFYPISNDLFNESLITCHGMITGGGFETPAEALYLGKRLMCIPIRGQYEQLCNVAALAQMGVTVLDDADTDHFADDISNWMALEKPIIEQPANQVMETLEYLVGTQLQDKGLVQDSMEQPSTSLL